MNLRNARKEFLDNLSLIDRFYIGITMEMQPKIKIVFQLCFGHIISTYLGKYYENTYFSSKKVIKYFIRLAKSKNHEFKNSLCLSPYECARRVYK